MTEPEDPREHWHRRAARLRILQNVALVLLALGAAILIYEALARA